MKRLYEKYLFLNPWIQGMIFLVFFYFLCAIISYFSFAVTFKYFIYDGNPIYFNISDLNQVIYTPFIFIFSIMSQLAASIWGFILFGAYYWTFSKNIKIVRILPLSNKQLFKNIFKQCGILYLVYFLIYILFIIFNLGLNNFILSLKNYSFIISFFVNNISILFSFLFVIIIDMQCKNSSLGKESNTFWCLLSFVLSIWFWSIILSLFNHLNLHPLCFPIFLMILIIIELTYIFKTINNLKIN